jgi:hypothetical protein
MRSARQLWLLALMPLMMQARSDKSDFCCHPVLFLGISLSKSDILRPALDFCPAFELNTDYSVGCILLGFSECAVLSGLVVTMAGILIHTCFAQTE